MNLFISRALLVLLPLGTGLGAHAQYAPSQVLARAPSWTWKVAPRVGSRWQMRVFERQSSVDRPVTAALQSKPESTELKGPDAPDTWSQAQGWHADVEVVGLNARGESVVRVTWSDYAFSLRETSAGSDRIPELRGQLARQTSQAARLLRGASWYFVQRHDGTVSKISGLSQLRSRWQPLLRSLPFEQSRLLQAYLEQAFSTASWQQRIERWAPQSTVPRKVGESWKVQAVWPLRSLFQVGPFTSPATRRLSSRARGVARLQETQPLRYGSAPGSYKQKLRNATVFTLLIDGAQSAHASIDEASGWPLEAQARTRTSALFSTSTFDADARGREDDRTSSIFTLESRTVFQARP